MRISAKTPYLDNRMNVILGFVNPQINDKILVIGTGFYPKTEYFLSQEYECKNITSGDIDTRNLENAKKILPGLKLVMLDAQKRFPFENHSFDKIIFTEVLEHLKNEKIALNEIRRVLKNDGSLIISVPKRRWFNIFHPVTWIQHKREYDEKRIGRVLDENGFRINKMFVGGNVFELFNIWIHLIYKYLFKIIYLNSFFKEKIDKAYLKNFSGKGTDIIILANKKN